MKTNNKETIERLLEKILKEIEEFNNNYGGANFASIDNTENYFMYLEQLKKEKKEIITYKEGLNLKFTNKKNEILENYLLNIEHNKQREKLRDQLKELTNNSYKETITKIENYAKNNIDGYNKSKLLRIEYFRQEPYQYKGYERESNLYINNINEAKFQLSKIDKTTIALIIEKYYNPINQ